MSRFSGAFPEQKLNPASTAYRKGEHPGNTSGLPGVDADLVAGNIRNGVTIFGVLGTYMSTLTDDIFGSSYCGIATPTLGGYYYALSMNSGTDLTLATLTQNYAANSRAVGVGVANGQGFATSSIKLRLFMNGVLVAESGYLVPPAITYFVIGSAALVGSNTCTVIAHNYNIVAVTLELAGLSSTSYSAAGIAVVSEKIT